MVEESVGLSGPPELHIGNEEVRKLANDPVSHQRTKQIDRRHHFIRERVERRHRTMYRLAKITERACSPGGWGIRKWSCKEFA